MAPPAATSRCLGAKEGRRATSPCPGQEPATNKTRLPHLDQVEVWKLKKSEIVKAPNKTRLADVERFNLWKCEYFHNSDSVKVWQGESH